MATAGLTRKSKSESSSAGAAASNGHPTKMIYYFGSTKTEGNGKQKQLLGGKGANLAEMTSAGYRKRLATAALPNSVPHACTRSGRISFSTREVRNVSVQ